MSNIAEFAEIPEYSVTDNMTLEDVNNLVTEIYTRNYKAVNGTTPPLHSADPILSCITWCCRLQKKEPAAPC